MALAVSGGSDSVALCMLARQVIPGDNLMAFMVNHGLGQRGITEDPAAVREILHKIGVKSEVVDLDWSSVFWDALSKGKLQERTREMRYEALFKACRRHDIPLLLTAHNLDDDVVTMFYRLGHFSGIDGMAAMKPATTFHVTSSVADRFFVGHPLLAVPKARLLATCEQWGLDWTPDHSNGDMDFRRNSILGSLRAAQEANPALTTESLQRMLNNFKRIRADIHDELVQAFDKSIIVNKVNGDCTMILNDEGWLRKKHIATRLLMLLLQYGAANRYPARTPSVNKIYDELIAAYEEHQRQQRAWLGRLPRGVRKEDIMPLDMTKRVGMRQHTLAGCAFYSLSRMDAMKRIALQDRLERRRLEYGPAFLIQRNPPARTNLHGPTMKAVDVTLGPRESFLWDDRVHLSFDHAPTLAGAPPAGSRRFTVSFMTPGDVKDFEALTKAAPQVRRRVYGYIGVTPGTHLYQIPVVREPETGYMAFPTLQTDFPPGRYKWKTTYAGTPILVSRFLCLP